MANNKTIWKPLQFLTVAEQKPKKKKAKIVGWPEKIPNTRAREMFANCTFCRRHFVIEFQVKLDCYSARGRGKTGRQQGEEGDRDSMWRQLVGLELQLWHRLALEFNYVARLFLFCFLARRES